MHDALVIDQGPNLKRNMAALKYCILFYMDFMVLLKDYF